MIDIVWFLHHLSHDGVEFVTELVTSYANLDQQPIAAVTLVKPILKCNQFFLLQISVQMLRPSQGIIELHRNWLLPRNIGLG